MLNISNMNKIWYTLRAQKEESGVASIFVVMTMMTLLALISIGFSHLMNREVRQAQDRQLSAEAYYAAESGLNDARAYLAQGGSKSDGCSVPSASPSPFVQNGNISGDGIARYTCLTIVTEPKELRYTIPRGQSIVVKLSGSELSNLSKFYFGWENARYTGNPSPLTGVFNQMPQQGSVGDDNTGLLRVGIYPLVSSCNNSAGDSVNYARYSAAVNSTDAAIECAARNYFLYPNTAPNGDASTVNFRNANLNGSTFSGKCTFPAVAPVTTISSQATPRYCNSVITNLYPATGTASGSTANSYYLRLTAVYNSISVSIQATDDTPGTPVALRVDGAEALIDVTGAGNDVLRRIQGLLPLQNNLASNYGLQSMESVCKLFRVPVEESNGRYSEAYMDGSAAAVNSDNICTRPTGSDSIDPGGLPPIDLDPPVPQCPSPPGPGPCAPPAPSINGWSWNGGNSFTYDVSNANYCEVHTDNPPGGVQGFAPSLGGSYGVTAGNGGGGVLYCWNGGVGPAVSWHSP